MSVAFSLLGGLPRAIAALCTLFLLFSDKLRLHCVSSHLCARNTATICQLVFRFSRLRCVAFHCNITLDPTDRICWPVSWLCGLLFGDPFCAQPVYFMSALDRLPATMDTDMETKGTRPCVMQSMQLSTGILHLSTRIPCPVSPTCAVYFVFLYS